MFERILIPLDGSDLAKQVFPCVSELARAFDPEIVLLGVCEPGESEYNPACRLYIEREAKQLRESLPGLTARLKTVVLEGRPAEQILDYAEKNNISLIVI